LLNRVSNSLIKLTENAVNATQTDDILFAGGVCSSKYISDRLLAHFDKSTVNLDFGDQRLAADNGVGIALLGGRKIWQ